ncbi:hypothetical protein HML84_10610 [Alcanivorax sp. IO_7]|nr:hypothetical protein HML84_10610 [Alcanivorax sp. IO_7]
MGDTLLIRAGLLNPVDANRWTFHREGGLLLEGERIVDAGPLARFATTRRAGCWIWTACWCPASWTCTSIGCSTMCAGASRAT